MKIKFKTTVEKMGDSEIRSHEILVDEEVAGWVETIVSEENEDAVCIDYLQLHEEFRNKGIGTKVIYKVLQEEAEYGFVYLAPTDENNQRLYERLGKDIEESDVSWDEIEDIDQGCGVYIIEN